MNRPSGASGELTVAICTADHPVDLEDLLVGLAPQFGHRPDCRLLVIDGSSEATRRFPAVESLVASNQLRWHRVRNTGIAAARNAALALCRTPLIAYLDDDTLALAGSIPFSTNSRKQARRWPRSVEG